MPGRFDFRRWNKRVKGLFIFTRFVFSKAMKPTLHFLSATVVLLFSMFLPSVSCVDSFGTGPSFKGPVGLQLYSFRAQFAKDVPGTLDEIKALGFENVELAGTYGLTVTEFKAQLDAHGLKAISAHYPFDQFRTNVDEMVFHRGRIAGARTTNSSKPALSRNGEMVRYPPEFRS